MKTTRTLLIALTFTASLASASASAATIFVRAGAPAGGNGASWATAYNDLGVALNAAASGDEVWVARGTYFTSNTGNRSTSFVLKSGVKLRGGFAGTESTLAQRPADPDLSSANPATDTILSGEIGTPGTADNALNVLRVADNANNQTMFERVVITAGNADGGVGGGVLAVGTAVSASNVLLLNNRAAQGGGWWASGSTGAALRDSFVIGNWTSVDGAGLFFSGGNATVERVTMRGNTAGQVGFFGAGGGLATTGATIAVRDCIFEQNSSIYAGGFYADSAATFERCIVRQNNAFSPADPSGATRGFGGGIFLGDGPTIRDTDIIENTGSNSGGMSNQGTVGATMINCRFLRNVSNGAGGAGTLDQQNARFINCLFVGNQSVGVGPMFSLRATALSSATFINCTSTGHAGGLFPGVIYNSGSVVILNSIFWNDVQEFGGNQPGVGWSNIRGFSGGLANISADPRFVNPVASDYRLMPGSPCIDAGRNDQVPLNILADLAGVPRFINDPATTDTGVGTAPIVDMGAYEFQAAPPPCLGDADGSRTVNFTDITSVLASFGTTYNPTGPGDADRNGTVNFTDITTVLANFGTTCP